ncbi:hypothetical protein HRS9122_10139 [Pyrenophora teres f. teres]|nr:hypothetical protein HRS9122_10139 [Pyrenophora teres f. teres]
MPFIAPKKTVPAVSTSWDSFPPPPPEAEKWKPPKDAIPMPGAVRDSRFNRDTAQDGHSKAYMKEAKVYSMLADRALSSPSVGSNSPAPGLGQWPAPAPRTTGRPIFSNGDHDKSSTGASFPTLGSLNSTSNKHQTAKAGGVALRDPANTTTKSVSKQQRSESPLVLSVSPMPPPHSETSMPAWAERLEKAMAEDTRNASPEPVAAMTAQIQVRPEIVHESSAPPLRHVQSGHVQARHLNPTAEMYSMSPSARPKMDTLIEEDSIAVDNHARRLVPTKARTQQVISGSSEAMRMPAIEQPIIGNATGNRNYVDHDHKIKVMIIRAMEHELDLYSVATERELMRMSRTDLDRYYEKAFSAHQCWWETKNGA